jgi:type IV pilus assembly protein PilX
MTMKSVLRLTGKKFISRDDKGRRRLWPQMAGRSGLVRDQRGFALILAIAMLAILSILGVVALSTSTNEIQRAGTYRTSQEAFNAAERAVQYAMGNSAIVYSNNSPDNPIDLNGTSTTYSGDISQDVPGGKSELDPNATNEVVNLGAGELPAKLQAQYGNEFGAVYYAVRVTGAFVSGTSVVSKVRVETQQARLYPKSNDQQFTTTSGG